MCVCMCVCVYIYIYIYMCDSYRSASPEGDFIYLCNKDMLYIFKTYCIISVLFLTKCCSFIHSIDMCRM